MKKTDIIVDKHRTRERLMCDPAKRAAIARARQRFAKELGADTDFPLTTLRLAAGPSQSDVAKRLNTQQPAIAGSERASTC